MAKDTSSDPVLDGAPKSAIVDDDDSPSSRLLPVAAARLSPWRAVVVKVLRSLPARNRLVLACIVVSMVGALLATLVSSLIFLRLPSTFIYIVCEGLIAGAAAPVYAERNRREKRRILRLCLSVLAISVGVFLGASFLAIHAGIRDFGRALAVVGGFWGAAIGYGGFALAESWSADDTPELWDGSGRVTAGRVALTLVAIGLLGLGTQLMYQAGLALLVTSMSFNVFLFLKATAVGVVYSFLACYFPLRLCRSEGFRETLAIAGKGEVRKA